MRRELLAALYLDYRNNYLTIEKFAEHNGLYVEEAQDLLKIARHCLEYPHPEA